ncbi:helix-turn-helix domain-containing protein [uncultured Clostridium sp.]|uniref:AraC family transcriptional regulator n=1 Tax=uncultured Clostridium sp. TaxID=59620 RepID=UPI0025E5475B|nr:helix-turn-helix domain-containing protein [uncultured Clostridium sp.]
MKLNRIPVDENLLETVSHGSFDFPMNAYYNDFSKYYMNVINWHWHPEIEFTIILKGKVEYHTENEVLILNEGEGIFVNANKLHLSKLLKEYENSFTISVVASTKLLCSDIESIIYRKYIKPIIECPFLSYIKLDKTYLWKSDIISLVLDIYKLKMKMPYGFELSIKNKLSEIWQLIVINTSSIYLNKNNTDNTNSLSQYRLKQMLNFIHDNYFKNITINDIAASANISRSECFRCFKKTINTKPFSYLTDFRLKKSMQLLMETDIPISDICYSCGFNHSSYYGKLFKDKFGISPSAYRKNVFKSH